MRFHPHIVDHTQHDSDPKLYNISPSSDRDHDVRSIRGLAFFTVLRVHCLIVDTTVYSQWYMLDCIWHVVLSHSQRDMPLGQACCEPHCSPTSCSWTCCRCTGGNDDVPAIAGEPRVNHALRRLRHTKHATADMRSGTTPAASATRNHTAHHGSAITRPSALEW